MQIERHEVRRKAVLRKKVIHPIRGGRGIPAKDEQNGDRGEESGNPLGGESKRGPSSSRGVVRKEQETLAELACDQVEGNLQKKFGKMS